jgi:hypothetical protein
MSQFSVSLTNFDVYACHCTLCQKWSGGIAMYLEAQGHPLVEDDSIAPSHFSSSARRTLVLPGLRLPTVV